MPSLPVHQGVAGETFSFYIYPRDQYGNFRDDTDVAFMLQDARQFSAEATLVDNRGHGRGTTTVPSTIEYDTAKHAFLVEYVPTISGVYSLNVTYQYWRFYPQLSVGGSPFQVTVSEARSFGARCHVIGQALNTATAGVQQKFIIHTRDALDNVRHVGGDTIDVMAYHQSGSYVSQGQVQVSYEYHINVRMYRLYNWDLTCDLSASPHRTSTMGRT